MGTDRNLIFTDGSQISSVIAVLSVSYPFSICVNLWREKAFCSGPICGNVYFTDNALEMDKQLWS